MPGLVWTYFGPYWNASRTAPPPSGSLRESACVLAQAHEASLLSGRLVVPYATPLPRYPLPPRSTRSLTPTSLPSSGGPVPSTVSGGVFITRASAGGARRRRSLCSDITALVPSSALPALHSPGVTGPSKPLWAGTGVRGALGKSCALMLVCLHSSGLFFLLKTCLDLNKRE